MEEVFHDGERQVQAMAGQREMADRLQGMVQSVIPGGVQYFLEQQPMVFIASTDKDNRLWASPLLGNVGFVKAALNHVTLDVRKLRSDKQDIFFQNLSINPEVGVLFIDLANRRRYRINGPATLENNQLIITIREAYGNCPKYIQRRELWVSDDSKKQLHPQLSGTKLGPVERAWIREADTFFLASRSKSGKTDTSHRGGNPGFIEIIDGDTLRIPDYPGNGLFNSLGNLHENPNVGLLFIDFDSGETLQLTGKARLQFDQYSKEDLEKTGETGRFWLFYPAQWRRVKSLGGINSQLVDYSPFNP